jgi:hypothetical protein
MSGEDPASGESSPPPDAASPRRPSERAVSDRSRNNGSRSDRSRSNGSWSDRSRNGSPSDRSARSNDDRAGRRRSPDPTQTIEYPQSTDRIRRSAGSGADGSPPTADLWDATPADDRHDGVPYELDVYAGLLEALLARGYEFVGFDGEIGDGQIVLRHDVDISVERAAAMARVEADLGIASTYCLLVTNPLYDLLAPENRAHVRAIVECGHDVGLHFDPHYYWDEEPAVEDLEARVVADRTALEAVLDALLPAVAPVVATSIHQPPDWALGARFDAFENAYEPRYFETVEYVSDSAGKWRSDRPFADGVPSAMQLLVHPGLWTSDDRQLPAILEERRERCHRRIEAYVGPFGG